jgi:hypothetical protein
MVLGRSLAFKSKGKVVLFVAIFLRIIYYFDWHHCAIGTYNGRKNPSFPMQKGCSRQSLTQYNSTALAAS